MRGLSFGTRAASQPAGGGSPTVFTLVLDDLLTRHYPGTDQRLKLTATAGTTDWIESDDNATLYSESVMAADMQAKLEALAGYSGKVTVSGSSTEAGDKYTFTITFDASLGAVTLDFHASSQWYPTITLTEAVTQQGAAADPEVVEISTSWDAENTTGTTVDSNGNSVTVDDTNTYVSSNVASGWTGGAPNNTMTFSKNAAGLVDPPSTKVSGPGTVTVTTLGTNGQPEIHTITPTPVNPTGGTWKPHASDSAILYDDAPTVGNGDGWDSANLTSGTTLAAGAVGFTNGVNGDIGDTALSPVNVSLTAPEITHSIT